MAFVDQVKIFVKAGNGGNGCKSFYRDKYTRYPKPDGGDGGRGGDVIIQTDSNVHTLLDFQFRQHFKAANGAHGGSNNKKGQDGKYCLIKVPAGTIVRDLTSNLVIRDLIEWNEQVIVAKGGEGGKGNMHVKETTHPVQGEERRLLLDLKLIADVGIVGLPNSGKSTLICAISQAKSKIASYPFTTKEPILGVVKLNDFRFVVADLPGLIAGAHQGKGLGDKFLRHIERTKIILHLIDIASSEGREALNDFKQVNHELESYSKDLAKKPQVIVANKMDLEVAKENLIKFRHQVKQKVFSISALKNIGINILLNALKEKLECVNKF